MIRILREIWRDLGRSILVGERYEKNMRGIMLVALLILRPGAKRMSSAQTTG